MLLGTYFTRKPDGLPKQALINKGREQVLVIIVGVIVAGVNRWKLKLYSKAFAEEANRSGHARKQNSRRNDVLFGARALESGVQVDGVYSPRQYVSRQNIAWQVASQSPASSIHQAPVYPTAVLPKKQRRGPVL